MDDATVATTKSAASAKGMQKCVCSWKNCRTYQKAYRSVGHPVLDGTVKVKFVKGDTASIPLKASVDRTLKVSKEKRQDWKPAKGEEIIRYNIARHHFTEAHILKYLKNPKTYKWTSLFSAAEAKKYLFKLDPKETMSLGDSEVYYVQCPNVSKEFVKEQFLQMKAAMEENQRMEEERKKAQAAAGGGGLDNYLQGGGGKDSTAHSGSKSLPSQHDDPSTATSRSALLLKQQEDENERLRKELESCQSQLSYLNEIVRQLQEDANDNMSVYSRKSTKSRTSRKNRFPHEILLDDDESEWDGGNDDDQDWSEGIDEDETINDDESSAFLGPAMMKKSLGGSAGMGPGGGVARRNSLNSRQSRQSIVSASQTVKSLPREIELADAEANGSGSDDSDLKDDFDEMSYVSRGSRVSRNRDRGGSRDGDARSVNSRRDKNRRRRQQKGTKALQSSSSQLDTGSDGKSVSWDGNDVEVYEVKQQVIVDPYGEKGTYAGTLSKGTGMPHGKGRLEYAAGRWYEGEWKHGRWTGQGRLSNGDGDLYEGELRNDHKHGKGTMRFADGRVFVGEYVNGQMTEGKMIYQDGSTYEGGWADGMRHGRGKCVFTDESIYEGEFREGEFHGHGKMTWSDGGWYEGEWWNGEMHGHGKEIRPNGTLRHEGAWSKGQPMRKKK